MVYSSIRNRHVQPPEKFEVLYEPFARITFRAFPISRNIFLLLPIWFLKLDCSVNANSYFATRQIIFF
jgi:hypothetical protein